MWQIPPAGRHSRGKPIVNLLNIDPEDDIASVVAVREFSDDRYLLFCTKGGKIKKTALSAYGNVRAVGLIGINVREGDELIDVQITGGDNEVILATRNGIAIRFRESDARVMGRVAEGVRGIRLSEGDEVVGMVVVVRDQATLLVVSERGRGKRTEIDANRLQKRGGKGVINLKTNEKTGKVIAIKSVVPEDQLMLITRNGVINRQRVDEIRVIGRATQGVRLVNLDKNDRVMDVASVFPEDPTNGSTELDGSVDGEGPDAEGPDTEGPDAEGPDADGLEGEGADDGESAEASVDADTGDVAEMDSDTEGE